MNEQERLLHECHHCGDLYWRDADTRFCPHCGKEQREEGTDE